ncbi:hypothetical protein RA276_30660, partial [Pseudomonas syringae pv. tagetis]|uniref:hypothetical protein n=1 Tax=Pseudomonas syringae group genomosp. 7 TaxID=251699 RepID=UPI00376FDA01
VIEDHEIASIILEEALSDKKEQHNMNGMKKDITNDEDLKQMLDCSLRESETFWNEFYSNRERNIPFFENKPDENLVSYFKL